MPFSKIFRPLRIPPVENQRKRLPFFSTRLPSGSVTVFGRRFVQPDLQPLDLIIHIGKRGAVCRCTGPPAICQRKSSV